MNHVSENYDVIVVGAGHAGCEAALACARLGLETIIFTVSMDSVAMMPCNPHIGGSSKGHLVREIDALGGQMGINIDKTFLQSKMLNASKGPAVHSLRCQADKYRYSVEMRKTLQAEEHLTLRQAEITEILTKNGSAAGCRTFSGASYWGKAVILATGTYLRARCFYGDVIEYTGPNGLRSANHLTASLEQLGIALRRFKTGTPARIDRSSIDFSRMQPQYGDSPVVPFSFTTDPASVQKEQVTCYLTYTNERGHRILRENIDRSPIYAGVIEGTGPRYCPSIEDKVVKFPDKSRHQLFVEPEGLDTNEMYISGASSSMPEDVQYDFYHTVPGLEHAKITRNAYAIEYDCIDANQLDVSLEFKEVPGLFAGGQFNGSSGYEEAAAQGLIAGINAAMKVQERKPLILDRSSSYIGVLIDDLVTKESFEPYRMMTSRAEYRLLLRQDNADLRLTPLGYQVGLISEDRYRKVQIKRLAIERERERIKGIRLGGSRQNNDILQSQNSSPIPEDGSVSLEELIRRPELSYQKLVVLDPGRPSLAEDVCQQINIGIKYQGYIDRQIKQVEHFKKLEEKVIPEELDYAKVDNLRIEARQKLSKIRPKNIGQASRISGVSPADISVLMVYIKQGKYLER